MEILNKKDIDISVLLEKFVFQMTGLEVYNLIQAALSSANNSSNAQAELCTGIHALAEQLGCCESTIYMLRREGVLDDAVKSQVGKKIVFDVEKARTAADRYQKNRRSKNDIHIK